MSPVPSFQAVLSPRSNHRKAECNLCYSWRFSSCVTRHTLHGAHYHPSQGMSSLADIWPATGQLKGIDPSNLSLNPLLVLSKSHFDLIPVIFSMENLPACCREESHWHRFFQPNAYGSSITFRLVRGKGAARPKTLLGGIWDTEEPFAEACFSSPYSYLLCRHVAIVAKGPFSWVAPPSRQSFLPPMAAQPRASIRGLRCLSSRLWMGCSVLKFGNESESTCETCWTEQQNRRLSCMPEATTR